MTHTTDGKLIVLYSGVREIKLHVGKTKEMVIDFRRNQLQPAPVVIGGMP